MATSLRCVHAPSSANLFVQLARRTAPTSTTSSAPILSVLIPRWNATNASPAADFGASRRYSTEMLSRRRPAAQRLVRRSAQQQQQVRTFTASAARAQTRCVYNPQKDEDGQDMHLEITDRAGKVR